MKSTDLYEQAHVFLAGIRVFEHLHGRPPTLQGLSEFLKISEEELSLLARKLEDRSIIRVVQAGSQIRYSIADHTGVEDLPRGEQSSQMKDEISQFQNKQQSRLKEIEKTLGRSTEKSKIFSDLDKALKDPSVIKPKKNPLD
jgi:DNA-directed RNA polymerase specialized sigma subunit